MRKKKHKIMLAKNELILDGTYRKVMSKKRWKKPNEILWSTMFMVALFMFSADNFAISFLALGIMLLSAFKLKDMDLSEECNSGLSFDDH